jgi:hypothetical protein
MHKRLVTLVVALGRRSPGRWLRNTRPALERWLHYAGDHCSDRRPQRRAGERRSSTRRPAFVAAHEVVDRGRFLRPRSTASRSDPSRARPNALVRALALKGHRRAPT